MILLGHSTFDKSNKSSRRLSPRCPTISPPARFRPSRSGASADGVARDSRPPAHLSLDEVGGGGGGGSCSAESSIVGGPRARPRANDGGVARRVPTRYRANKRALESERASEKRSPLKPSTWPSLTCPCERVLVCALSPCCHFTRGPLRAGERARERTRASDLL